MAADLLYSETERDLAATLSDLLTAAAAPADVLARTEQPETYDAKLWRTVAAEIGIAGLLIPEPLGGAGPDPVPRQRRRRDRGAAVGRPQRRRRRRRLGRPGPRRPVGVRRGTV